jgi:hypothetical protein
VKYQTGSEPSFNKIVLDTDFRTIGRRSLYLFLALMQWLMRLARPIHGVAGEVSQAERIRDMSGEGSRKTLKPGIDLALRFNG